MEEKPSRIKGQNVASSIFIWVPRQGRDLKIKLGSKPWPFIGGTREGASAEALE